MNQTLQLEARLDREHQKITDVLRGSFNIKDCPNIEEVIKEMRVLQKFSITNNKYHLLWHTRKFLPIYVSDNVIDFGYTPEELYNLNLFQAMQRVVYRQIPLVFKLLRNGVYFNKLIKSVYPKNQENFICGSTVKDKWGNTRVFFVKQKALGYDKKGQSAFSFLEVEEISPIFVGKGWMKLTCQSANGIIQRVFFADKNRNMANELLSERELEILRLIVDEKDSKTIAEILHIGYETVKKHRKNMIAKVGAKDMTALIYFCRQANVI